MIPSLQMGGAERQACGLARWLRDSRGAEVEVWGLGKEGPVSALLQGTGIPWRAIALGWPRNPWMRAKGLLRFARALRTARPNV
ncbi:MAG TPA: glycosyltransferase, partial [Thermoanaerobaculia bacterium]|nr:glycosyltransferase [Thermoanaerobaculia bacterium]